MRHFAPKAVFAFIPRYTQINCSILVRGISDAPAAKGIRLSRYYANYLIYPFRLFRVAS